MTKRLSVISFCAGMVLGTTQAQAQWLCREASSTRTGSTITACGVGQAEGLDDARNNAREQATAEFNRICVISSDCRNFDYDVFPKRTDCEESKGIHTCFRAIDFEVSSTKRSSVYIDVHQVELELDAKRREIAEIESKIEKLKVLAAAKEESQRKQADLIALEYELATNEGAEVKLQQLSNADEPGYKYTHLLYKNSFKTAVKFWDTRFTSSNEINLILDIAYEFRPIHWLGIQVNYGLGADFGSGQVQSAGDVPQTASPNSHEQYDGKMRFNEIGLAALLYTGIHGTYLKGEVGQANATRGVYDVTYGPLGTGMSTSQSNVTHAKTFSGLGLGFDSRNEYKGLGFFFELGARKSNDDGKLGTVGSAGLNFGF